ncbi:hypothetical protein [Arthrobacter agilis]|uniref:hypothetical protein n=1 Tax=Arthrobacter agilis TaxID=37921 RepID=UPI00278BAB3B|nr:hypothetical protein [Arthrobacter agilis]MDQ0735169.1 hypothetical protein [Arthrobacter agilis]
MEDLVRRLVVLVGVAAVATACGGAPAESPTSPAESSSAQEQTSATPSATLPVTPAATEEPAAAPELSDGPTLITCSTSGTSELTQVEVWVIDAETAVLTPISDMTIGDTPSCPSGAFSADRMRQWFSDDYARSAADFKRAEDNSSRVGWVDMQAKELTDFSEKLAGGSGGFAAAPQHWNALFAPDGSLFFFDQATQTYNWADADAGGITRTVPMGDVRPPVFLDAVGEPQRVDNMGTSLSSCNKTVAPDGQSQMNLDVQQNVLAWVDDTSAFQLTEDGQLSVVEARPPSESQGFCNFPGKPITPVSDFEITTAIVNPEGTHAFFIAYRGTETSLFKVPMDGSGQPELVGPVEGPARSRYFLTDWDS